jgi:hypothetical protein
MRLNDCQKRFMKDMLARKEFLEGTYRQEQSMVEDCKMKIAEGSTERTRCKITRGLCSQGPVKRVTILNHVYFYFIIGARWEKIARVSVDEKVFFMGGVRYFSETFFPFRPS